MPNFYYRLFHSKYILVNTKQVHDAFFTPETPTSVVKSLERLLSPYESMLWPMQALFKFVTGPDVLSSITGWTTKKSTTANKDVVSQNMLVLAAEHDVLCTPPILQDAAERYRSAFVQMVGQGKVDGVSKINIQSDEEKGVRFRIVKGLGHHLQNHVEWERGAEEVLEWVEELS
jgi:hypothetical protein